MTSFLPVLKLILSLPSFDYLNSLVSSIALQIKLDDYSYSPDFMLPSIPLSQNTDASESHNATPPTALARSLDGLKIPKNFISYAFSFPCQDSRDSTIEDLLLLWQHRDPVESLAGFYSVVDTTLGVLKDAMAGDPLHDSHAVAEEVYKNLSQDVVGLHEQLMAVLRDPEAYKNLLASRDDIAQQLLDLLQDMLDLFLQSTDRPLIFKALLRLSRTSELLLRCFTLNDLQKVGEQVAAGGFGDIWKGLVRGQSVSVKIMRLFRDADIKQALEESGREALIWRQLSHPNLLPFFGLYYLERRLCLVSPWMSNGHILEFLKTAPPDTDRLSLMLDVAMGLEYLHKENIVHGDLKAMNVLVTPSCRACLADFGLSSMRDVMSVKFTHTTANIQGGTARYQAPELILTNNPTHFTSDIYAFACVCYEILTEKCPFFELKQDVSVSIKVKLEGLRPSRPNSFPVPRPEPLWTLLQDCWKESPLDRPSVTQIIQKLVDPAIGAVPKEPSADWDDTFSSKLRQSSQDRYLLPSVTKIERRIFGDHIAEACRHCFPSKDMGLRNPSSPTAIPPQIHPWINGDAPSSVFHFDLSPARFTPLRFVLDEYPPQVTPLNTSELRAAAFHPPRTSLRIVHPQLPFSPIDLKPPDMSRPALPVALGDILVVLHESLHKRITIADWAVLNGEQQAAISRTFTMRCRVEAASSGVGPAQLWEREAAERQRGVKRVDFLCGKTVFRGFVRSPEDPEDVVRMVTA